MQPNTACSRYALLRMRLNPELYEKLWNQMNNLRRGGIPPWVPTEMLVELDLMKLAATDTAVLRERELLSSELRVNVAAYRATAKGRPHGLCSVYRAAEITAAQIQKLRLSERKFARVVFVAYRKPLQRHGDVDV